ncbi:protein SPEAR1-like isoform X3 [Sesamum indicum]|uniref:Protein SPEAR1-like isoform X3 n=1 Tax=Sesamum indicum TaxID=4182 RepID=A0A8M8UTN0_SESIN|nr:protein SPEAR1-like isoform X3 [Sesamum indicum]XP_020549419.1 protein SPEAR1-like isoform X3 [Sesamum indicum]
MGSNYYGEGNPGNERGSGFSSSSSSSSSSRKGKKGSSDKPKQPQRGLGVAQLEKIRLHSQLGSNYLPPVHNPYAPSFSQMGLPDLDRTNIRYGDTQSSSTISRWHSGNAGLGTQHFVEPSLTTRPFFQPTIEGSINKNKQDGNNPMGSSSQNTESSSSEDIDLELRLSL